MNTPKISVIVPVYNVEQYLPRCIDSILAQTFTDFELLLIDDGSTDRSGKICDEYANKDGRVRVFHKENEGISTTREFGINNALGEYIQFVDSDDWIDPNMFEEMHKKATNTNADIVGCSFIQEYENKGIKTKAIYSDKLSFLHSVISNYWGVLWKLLIRKTLFISYNIHFPKGINGGEDYYVIICLLLKANSVEFVDFYPYHYVRTNNGSFISTPTFERLMFQIKSTYLVEEQLHQNNRLCYFSKDLEKRKVYTKTSILRKYPFKGLYLYPELNISSTKEAIGLKNKALLFLSIVTCKIRSKLK